MVHLFFLLQCLLSTAKCLSPFHLLHRLVGFLCSSTLLGHWGQHFRRVWPTSCETRSKIIWLLCIYHIQGMDFQKSLAGGCWAAWKHRCFLWVPMEDETVAGLQTAEVHEVISIPGGHFQSSSPNQDGRHIWMGLQILLAKPPLGTTQECQVFSWRSRTLKIHVGWKTHPQWKP